MITFLRCLGKLNAAVWFGSAIFFTFAAAPAVFSGEMRSLLGENNYSYFSGAIAQIIFRHLTRIMVVCAIIAIFHWLGERLYFGRSPDLWRGPLLIFIVILTILGGFVARPKLEKLHKIKYASNTAPEIREAAIHSFRAWHGASQIANVFLLAALGVYVCRIGHRPE